MKGGGVINYNDLWSTPCYNPANTLLHDYTFRSGTAMDFMYIKFNTTYIAEAGVNYGVSVMKNDNTVVKYSNGIPIDSDNNGFDFRTSNTNCVYILCYSFACPNYSEGTLLDTQFKLYFPDNSSITVYSPATYYKVSDNFKCNVSGATLIDNLSNKIVSSIGFYSVEDIKLLGLTCLILRVNLPSFINNYVNDIYYFKENIDKQTSANTQPVLPLKTYTTYSKFPYNDSKLSSSNFVIGQVEPNSSYTANINYLKMMYQTAFIAKVTTYCENSNEAGPITAEVYNEPIIRRLDNTSNTQCFYMPPLYQNLGCNYSWIPMCYPVNKTDKLKMLGGFNVENSFAEVLTFAGIGNTETINNNGQYSVSDRNTLRNLFSIDTETGCNTMCTPYLETSSNIFQLQVSTGIVYLNFVEKSSIPAEVPWSIQSSNLNIGLSKLYGGINYNWLRGQFKFYSNNHIMLFAALNITSSTVDDYIDATIQITFEPMTGSDYSTTVPTFASNLTANMDIIRYKAFGYTSSDLNLSNDDFFMMDKLTGIQSNTPYVGFINVINNSNAKIHFNRIKLLLLEIQT